MCHKRSVENVLFYPNSTEHTMITTYPDWYCVWFSSDSPVKCWLVLPNLYLFIIY